MVGAVDGVLSFAKMTKLAGAAVSFFLEFIPSVGGGDGILEAFICAFLAALISLFLSGTKMLNVGKSKYYTYILLKKLKAKKWSIIKKGVKTCFRKIFKHLKKFTTNSAITALFGLSNHTNCKATKAMKRTTAAL